MASSVAPASTTPFTSLLPRPPTPPRETSNESDVSVKSVLSRSEPSDSQPSVQTPPNANTPTSLGVTESNLISSRARKKVVWSAHTEYKEPIDYRNIEKLHKSSPICAPSPVSKPIKGILKPSASPNCLSSSLSHEFDATTGQPNIIEMLDSTIKQLAGSDRDSKLDAYMMLSRALKVSNNLPDRVALQDKMSLFMQFIQRDLMRRNDDGSLDTSMINHALTLLATFLHFPAIASTLTSDFGIFILDHSIRSFEDASMPKDVVRHLMQVVAFQNFSPKVMTADRVGRLVAVLHQIEDHLKGKSIVMSRIHIYKRLVKQARSHMAIHSSWLKDMLTDMLSTVNDIRMQAIGLATEAGFALRSEKQLIRKASEIFQTTNEDQTYIEFYMHRLQEMLRDRHSSSAVPQIWSAIILFMRCPLERWQYYGPWLTLVQSAFNMTDSLTKQEANYAWNRYVYLSLADSKVSPKLLGTLCQPLTSQLRRKANAKQLEEAMKLRRVVIGGICNLYYYAFAPGNDRYSPDVVWDVAVQPVMSQLINLDGKPDIPGDCLMQANRMLLGLLDVATPRIWRHDRIMETPPTTPDELPPLDSKWVRRNCEKVFQLASPILEKKITDLANKESLAFRLWQAIVGSVANASAKDIKVSDDTANFVAQTFALLSKIWSTGVPGDDVSQMSAFLSGVGNFISIMVHGLGMLPFTEKKLSMTVTNTFEPVATPSHTPGRSDKSQGIVRTPLHHLFIMFCSVPRGGKDDDDLSNFFLSTFEPFFHSRSVKVSMELAHELLQLLPHDAASPYGPWLLVSQILSPFLEPKDLSTASLSDGKLFGPTYRDMVLLLEQGLAFYPNLPSTDWFLLFDRLCEHVVKEFGDAGRALVVIEPIAKAVLSRFDKSTEKQSTISLKPAQALFEVAKLPRDRNALNTAKQRLWGIPVTSTRGSNLDPFENLYKLGNKVLELLYERVSDSALINGVPAFIRAVEGFAIRSHSQVGVQAFSKLQSSLCLWIRDESSRLQPGDKSELYDTIFHAWDQVSSKIAGHGQLGQEEFEQIEPLLTAAFQSKHGDIVQKATDIWNIIAKDEDNLMCSDSLRSVASSFGSKAEAVSLGLEDTHGEFGAQASAFTRPAEDISFVVLSTASSHQDNAPESTSPVKSMEAKKERRTSARRRSMKGLPEITRTRISKRKSTPRLRHDDSQLQFVAVVPSPLPVEESQHLTERQKEVRERQRENAILYSDQHTSSLAAPEEKLQPQVEAPTGHSGRPGETTPRRDTTYDNHVSSTPTPRRGQVIHMDDNDPPSSPPEPRPYPLLSEIQSRSRASSSMDNWEFSSPPGSPITGHDPQPAQDLEMPDLQVTDNVQNAEAGKTTRTKPLVNDGQESMDIIPSSAVADESLSDLTDIAEALISSPEAPKQPKAPTTPSRRLRQTRSSAAEPVEESPKSGDDEFVDARSSPGELPTPTGRLAHDSIDNDTSFALSEGDESRMMKFAAELESRRFNTESPTKVKSEEKADACITVQVDECQSPSLPRTRGAAKRASFPTIPSTPAEPTESGGESKKKRKRSRSRQSGGRAKKRRPESKAITEGKETLAHSETKANSPTPSEQPSAPLVIGVETRGSARKRHQQRQNEEAEVPFKQTNKTKRRQGGDTDDEVMSQLVTESIAASQSQSQSGQQQGVIGEEDEQVPCTNDDEGPEAVAGVMNATVTVGVDEQQPRGDEASKTESLTIIEALRNGLEQLRKVSLSRDEVYKMEDMLMDMKRELFEAERRGRSSR